MTKKKKPERHLLVSSKIAKTVVEAARITQNDDVFERASGNGILIPLLCESSGNVIATESDAVLYENLKTQFGHLSNLNIQTGGISK